VTLHRPSNVDDSEMLLIIMETLQRVAEKLTVVFPVHPRTRQHLQDLQFSSLNSGLHLIDPVGYIEFLALQKKATVVITDSGGIQEETTFLGIPCLTLRKILSVPLLYGKVQINWSESMKLNTRWSKFDRAMARRGRSRICGMGRQPKGLWRFWRGC